MPSRDLRDCEPLLADTWKIVAAEYHQSHGEIRLLILTATYRPPAEQFALFKVGRRLQSDGDPEDPRAWGLDTDPATAIVTQLDGRRRFSKHNLRPARALDFCVLVGGKVSWDPREYSPVGRIATTHQLIWGGDWATLKDYPHVELK